MRFLESLIIGLVSGLTEFLPISSEAHRQILCTVFGSNYADPVRDLFIHIAVFFAVYTATAKKRERLEQAHKNQQKRRRLNGSSGLAAAERQLLHMATIPFLIVFITLYFIWPFEGTLLQTSLCLIINGIIIFMPERMLQGNKNAKVISTFEVILIGSVAGLSVIAGFSRVGCMISIAAFCGADRKSSAGWALLLSVSAQLSLLFTDVLNIFAINTQPFWSNLLFYLINAVFSFIGAQGGMYILRKHISKNGCSAYAYYCWGAALLALILFLTIA